MKILHFLYHLGHHFFFHQLNCHECMFFLMLDYCIFSLPVKSLPFSAQVHYCDHALSVVCPLTFHVFFYFSSETAERNSTNLDRNQDLNVLYQVCIFRVDRKTKMATPPLIHRYILDFLSETAERDFTKLERKQDLNILIGRDIFDFFSEIETWQEVKYRRSLLSLCFFRFARKTKMAALVSDWLWHFRLLLWNHWSEFKEILFFGQIGKPRWPPCQPV